jgi:hypothetical protein
MATKKQTTDAAAADREPTASNASGNDIPDSSLTSAVTSDLPADGADIAEQEKAMEEVIENQDPATKAGIGLVKVDGIDFRYVGVAPARDKDAKTESGYPITALNSTFTPLDQVPFHNSIRVKDPKSGEFYYPADGVTSWAECELNGSKLF